MHFRPNYNFLKISKIFEKCFFHPHHHPATMAASCHMISEPSIPPSRETSAPILKNLGIFQNKPLCFHNTTCTPQQCYAPQFAREFFFACSKISPLIFAEIPYFFIIGFSGALRGDPYNFTRNPPKPPKFLIFIFLPDLPNF